MEASGVVGAPAQGAPAAGTPAGTGGQGPAAGQPTGGVDDGFWGNFPNVPETQRELLGPHLKDIQGYVTKLEQQYSPYKGLTEAVPPEQVEQLVSFLNNYGQDPTATWLGMAQQLQQEGAIHEGLTMEQLQAIIRGEQLGQGPEQVQPQQQQEQVPEWAQQLQQRLDQMDQVQTQQEMQAQEAEQAQMLDGAKAEIRTQLTNSNIPAEAVSDEMIVAAIIACDGDMVKAASTLVETRDKLLGAFTNDKTGGTKQPAVNGKLPTAPKGKSSRRGDAFAEANVGARQFLEQQQQMANG